MGLILCVLACGGRSVAEFRQPGIHLQDFMRQGKTILGRGRELAPLCFRQAFFKAQAIRQRFLVPRIQLLSQGNRTKDNGQGTGIAHPETRLQH